MQANSRADVQHGYLYQNGQLIPIDPRANEQKEQRRAASAKPQGYLGAFSEFCSRIGRGALNFLSHLIPTEVPFARSLVTWVDSMRQPPAASVQALSNVVPVNQLNRGLSNLSVASGAASELVTPPIELATPPIEIEVLDASQSLDASQALDASQPTAQPLEPAPFEISVVNNIRALEPSAKKEAILALADQLLTTIDGYNEASGNTQSFAQLKAVVQHHQAQHQTLSVAVLDSSVAVSDSSIAVLGEAAEAPSVESLFTKELDQTVEVFASVAQTLNRYHQVKQPQLSHAQRQENISLWVGGEKALSEVQSARALNYTAQRPRILRQTHQGWHDFNRWSAGFGVMQKIFAGMNHAHSDYAPIRNADYMQSALKLLNEGALNVDASLTTKADARLKGGLDKIKSILQSKNWASVAMLDNNGKAAFAAVQALLEGKNSSITNVHQLRDQLRIVSKVLSQFSPQNMPSTHGALNYWLRNTFQVYGQGQKPLLTLADGMALKNLVEPLLESVDHIASFSREVGVLFHSLGLFSQERNQSSQDAWNVDSFQKLFQVVRDLKPMQSSMDALGYLLEPCTSHDTNLRHNLQQLHRLSQSTDLFQNTDHSIAASEEAVLALGAANLEAICAKSALDTADQQFQVLNAFYKERNSYQAAPEAVIIPQSGGDVVGGDVVGGDVVGGGVEVTADELDTEALEPMDVRYQAKKDTVQNDILEKQVLTPHGRMSALDAAHWGYLDHAFPGQYSGVEQKNLYLLEGSPEYEKVKNAVGEETLKEQGKLGKEAQVAATTEEEKAKKEAASKQSWSEWSASMSKSAQENFTYCSDVAKAITFPDRSASPDLTWDQHLGQAIMISGLGLGVVTGKLSWDALVDSSLGALLPDALAAGSWLGTGLNALRLASAVPTLGGLSVAAGVLTAASLYTLGVVSTVRLTNDEKRKAESFLKDAAIDANAVVIANELDQAEKTVLLNQRQAETEFFQQRTLGETLNLCAATKAALFNTAFMSFSSDDEVLSPFNIQLQQCSDLFNQHSQGSKKDAQLSSPPANLLGGLESEVKQQVIDGNFDQAFQSLSRIPDVNQEVKSSKVVVAREILRLAQLQLSNNITCYIARAVREGREPNAVEREVVLAHLQSYKGARDAFASLEGVGVESDKDLAVFNQRTHELAVGLKNPDAMIRQIFYHLKSPIESVRTLSDQQWRASDTTGVSRLGNKLQNPISDVHLRNFTAGYEKKFSQEIHHIERLPKQGATQLLANHGLHTIEVSVFNQKMQDYLPKSLYRVVIDHSFFSTYMNEQLFSQVGCIDGSSKVHQAALRAGNTVLVFPGGTEEAIDAYNERNRLHVSARESFDGLQHKPRFGVIRDQLQFGSSIYPVLEPRAEDVIPSGTLDGLAKALYSWGRQATGVAGNFLVGRPAMKVDAYVCPRIEPGMLPSSRQGIEDADFQSALQDQHRIVYNQMQSSLKALDVFTPFQTVVEHKAGQAPEPVSTVETTEETAVG